MSEALVAAGTRPVRRASSASCSIAYEMSIAPAADAALAPMRRAATSRRRRALTEWVERLLKVYSTEQRALHDEVAELLTYSVQAAETEQATQNIAIETLKLSNRTADGACAAATPPRSPRIHDESLALSRDDGLDADLAAHPVGDDRRARPVAKRARHHARRAERAEAASSSEMDATHPPHDRRRALPERDADAQRRADRRARPQHPDLRRRDRPAARLGHRPRRRALDHPAAAPPAEAA